MDSSRRDMPRHDLGESDKVDWKEVSKFDPAVLPSERVANYLEKVYNHLATSRRERWRAVASFNLLCSFSPFLYLSHSTFPFNISLHPIKKQASWL